MPITEDIVTPVIAIGTIYRNGNKIDIITKHGEYKVYICQVGFNLFMLISEYDKNRWTEKVIKSKYGGLTVDDIKTLLTFYVEKFKIDPNGEWIYTTDRVCDKCGHKL
jgi:hypothetical protein